MMDLRALGFRFALDDFGTGYSSLIYLRRFAFDKIKIDRSFLEFMETTGESAILVHSVVHLGRALGLTVTAEGVETPEQQRFLQAVGCHQLQGFLFCKPVPAQEIDELLGLVDDARSIARSPVGLSAADRQTQAQKIASALAMTANRKPRLRLVPSVPTTIPAITT